ncbi:sugar porter family MFS transporter [Rhizosaccharibacter radicis]|uniref:Sugar porter family MFS transporter n=1 Tax=Rhizosaccharibacter radicis TaxID=2782605 RepID=A0ABT1VSG8_9PROT|nr:sugar porter family MFS transporter [Acetobacteraceae bacterium KSS12]
MDGTFPNRVLGMITATCTLGGLLFGYDTGVINGALLYIRLDLHLGPLREGMVISSLLVGAALGAVSGGQVSDRIGRRRGLLCLAMLFFVGALAASQAPGFRGLVLARLVLGVAVGGASVLVPTYLAEIAPASVRGRVVTFNELMIVGGQLLAFCCNAVLAHRWGHEPGIWRWMLVVSVVPAAALWLGMLAMPESPRWLMAHGRREEAREVLARMRAAGRLDAELHEVEHLAEQEQLDTLRAAPRDLLADLRAPWIRRIFLIGIGVACSMQATGVSSVMYYGTQLLTGAGFTERQALLANIGNGVASVAATLLGLWILTRTGRRFMLTAGLTGTASALAFAALVSLLFAASPFRGVAILAATMLFLLFMQGFVAPVAWVILAEIFPLRIRGIGNGIAALCLWLVNFAVGLLFPSVSAALGSAGTFGLFAAFSVLGVGFAVRFVPETRGYSLEQIEENFRLGRGVATAPPAGPA